MSQITEEMRGYVDRARNGDWVAVERIKRYLRDQAFPLFGEEMWPLEERQYVLDSDERSIEAMEIIIGHIDEANA